MTNARRGARLTAQNLQNLKDLGFRFVLIKGYTPDWRADSISLNHFILAPVKHLPEDPAEKEIYEPIDSEILLDWATPNSEVIAFIQTEGHVR